MHESRWLRGISVGLLAWGCSIYDGTLLSGDASPVGPGAGGSDQGASGAGGVGGDGGSSSVAVGSPGGASSVAAAGSAGAGSPQGIGGEGGSSGASGSGGSAGSGGNGGGAGAGGTGSPEAGPDRTSGTGGAAIDPVDAAVDAVADAVVDVSCAPVECALKASLRHRYSFNGSGGVATDSIGAAHGAVVNAQLSGGGALALAGMMSDQYVDLPNNIVSRLTDATIETWVTWSGGGVWQRIFDFGSSDMAENVQGLGATTFYLTPQGNPSVLLVGFKRPDVASSAERHVAATVPLAIGVMAHVAVVVDDTHDQMLLYRDGALAGSAAFPDSLAILNDVNNWLGRSQYLGDLELGGTLHEFRIYGAALSAAQVAASFAAGPDPAFLQ